jgi:hypothetical protein
LANYFFRRWLQVIGDDAIPAVVEAAPLPDSGKKDPSPVASEKRPVAGFVAEMKRRSVVRVGVAYAIAGWVLLQIGDIVFNFLEVPAWAGKLLIAFLVLGLPVALVCAWAFELTPEGVKRDKDVDRARRPLRSAGRKFDFFIIAILLLAVVIFALDKFF